MIERWNNKRQMNDQSSNTTESSSTSNCNNSIDDEEEQLEDFDIYRLDYEEKSSNSSSSSLCCNDGDDIGTPTSSVVKAIAAGGEALRPGDHVYMWCTLYQHHGIVLETLQQQTSEPLVTKENRNLCEKDTASSSSPESASSEGNQSQQPSILIAEFTNAALADESMTNNLFNSASVASDATSGGGVTGGFRIVLESQPTKWHKVVYRANPIQYMSWTPGTCSMSQPSEVLTRLYRVQFLNECRHLIPDYHLLASNCETCAVWCMTGKWETLQAQKAIELSQVGALAASSALMGPLVGVAAASTVALFWQSQSLGSKKEQTALKLNQDFQWYSLGKKPTKFVFKPDCIT